MYHLLTRIPIKRLINDIIIFLTLSFAVAPGDIDASDKCVYLGYKDTSDGGQTEFLPVHPDIQQRLAGN